MRLQSYDFFLEDLPKHSRNLSIRLRHYHLKAGFHDIGILFRVFGKNKSPAEPSRDFKMGGKLTAVVCCYCVDESPVWKKQPCHGVRRGDSLAAMLEFLHQYKVRGTLGESDDGVSV